MQERQQRYSRPKRIGDVLAKLDERLENREHNPYRNRLDDQERWSHFGSLWRKRGARYARCTFENFDREQGKQSVVVELRKWMDNLPENLVATDGGGLMLLGPPGVGKDHLLFACLRAAVIEHGLTVEWRDGLRLFHEIKSAIATNRTEAMLTEVCKPQILALSDPVPPKDELTTYELAVLRDIVERRYSAMLSTWVTTNVNNSADAKRLFGEAVLDRLLHNSKQIYCDWESYRKPLKTH